MIDPMKRRFKVRVTVWEVKAEPLAGDLENTVEVPIATSEATVDVGVLEANRALKQAAGRSFGDSYAISYFARVLRRVTDRLIHDQSQGIAKFFAAWFVSENRWLSHSDPTPRPSHYRKPEKEKHESRS